MNPGNHSSVSPDGVEEARSDIDVGLRRGGRYRTGIMLAAFIALALGSFWILQVMRKNDLETLPDARKNEPDYYIEKFNFVRMSKTGEAKYNIAGTRMVHRPVDDTYEITLPVIHSLSENHPPIKMQALRAVADPGSSKIHMIEKVEVDRPASATTEQFHLTSDYLLILPDDEVLQTDKPVVMTLGTARLTGIGMVVNNATREFRLAHQVRGTYPPRNRVVRE
jgi:lipopolysaccharide export system protein LptC